MKFQNPDHFSELKHRLTSIKKMVGNDVELDKEEKNEKKKAYSNNICLREILSLVCENLECFETKRKLH